MLTWCSMQVRSATTDSKEVAVEMEERCLSIIANLFQVRALAAKQSSWRASWCNPLCYLHVAGVAKGRSS